MTARLDSTANIVLASASPRRSALLAALGVAFDVLPSNAPEVDEGSCPETIVKDNAALKCREVVQRVAAGTVVIAADTLVFLDGQVLSKPSDLDEARDMLQRLSGNTHQVMTGLAVQRAGEAQCLAGVESTDVSFRQLSAAEIDRFVTVVQPLDRAGAYTVDGPGSLLVSRYHGCYQNVLGLPLVRLDSLLRRLGIALFDRIRGEHAVFL